MRLVTGRDRIAYEAVLQGMASLSAEQGGLHARLTECQAEITRLRADVSRERQRADNAIDELLAMRGIAPVSVPPEPRDLGDGDPFREDPEAVASLERRMRDQGIGALLFETGKE